MNSLPTVAAPDPEAHPIYRLLAPLEPIRVRLASALSTFLLRRPALGALFGRSLSLWDLIVGEIVYGRHVSSQATMWRARQKVLGDTFTSFRAVVHCASADVERLVEATPANLRRTHAFVAQYAQPDLLSPNTFLFTEGPKHDQHRAILIGRVLRRSAQPTAPVDAWLRHWRETADLSNDAVERVLIRSSYALLLGLELDDAGTTAALTWQRTFFSPVMFAPPWARKSLMAGAQRKLDEARATLEARIAAMPLTQEVAGAEQITVAELATMLFEVQNLNGAAIQSIALRVVRVIQSRPDLQATLREEHAALELDTGGPLDGERLGRAVKTEAFVLEVLRLYTRVTTVQWRSEEAFSVQIGGREEQFPAGTLRCANLATANVDPRVYPDPLEIRLDRDYGHFMNFNGIVSPRTCPGRGFALGLLVRFVVHLLAR